MKDTDERAISRTIFIMDRRRVFNCARQSARSLNQGVSRQAPNLRIRLWQIGRSIVVGQRPPFSIEHGQILEVSIEANEVRLALISNSLLYARFEGET